MTEANTLTNFNFGFSTYKSDILVHLSQWQYWWWFWFSFFWALYFFIVVRCLNKRTFQLNPVLNTSIRGHGKWGDFLVSIIPLSWCGNILVNSNFILRMIEWQNESSLFVLRIQGKQWYWVYKFDGADATSILAAPKNIGNDRWFVSTPNESYCADSYYQALHMGAQMEYKNLYLKWTKEAGINEPVVQTASKKGIKLSFLFDLNLDKDYSDIFNLKKIKNKSFTFYDFALIDDTSNFNANVLDSVKRKPLQFLKGVLNKHNIDLLLKFDETAVGGTNLDKNIMFIPKFNLNDGRLQKKVDAAEVLWGFKQKKYKRVQKFKFADRVSYDPKTFEKIGIAQKEVSALTLKSSMVRPFEISDVKNKSTQVIDNKAAFDFHRSIKFNRERGELVPVVLARRLLRTKRTLVLPAHVNITVITNSYDVVHSWFVPGLGLKLDCVPGRSTHHTFYVDNVGFYYGQCAEICGRYHHHMPIRLCALPFEQFLIWWQRRGVKRIFRISNYSQEKIVNPNDIKFRYKW